MMQICRPRNTMARPKSSLHLAIVLQPGGAEIPVVLGRVNDSNLLGLAMDQLISQADAGAKDHLNPISARGCMAQARVLRHLRTQTAQA